MKNPRLQLELIWWLITAVIVVMVLLPILRSFPTFPYLFANGLYVVAFVTFVRYTFLLRYTFLAQAQYLKIAFVALSAMVALLLILTMNDFQRWLTENEPDKILAAVPLLRREALLSYLHNEYIFFAVGSALAAVALAVRLSVSIWRGHNQGTV